MHVIEDAWTDFIYALRLMRAAPGFAAIAVATLALGIGANTAIFSVVQTVLLRPLPYADPGGLMHVVQNTIATPASTWVGAPQTPVVLDATQLAIFRDQTRTLSHVVAYDFRAMTLIGQGEAVALDGAAVSADAFEMFGLPPALGRTFGSVPAPELATVVMLSHRTWYRRFSGVSGVIGRTVTLDGRDYSVVGVMPPEFEFPDVHTEFWIPYLPAPATADTRPPRVPVVARVRDGATLAAATSEVNTILAAVGAGNVAPPSAEGLAGGTSRRPSSGATGERPQFALRGLEAHMVEPVRAALLVLTVAVGLVLLIACVNVANLLLARTATRARELATRLAVGADRWRLVRQMLTETVTLATVGAAAGTLLAYGGISLLRALGTTLARRDLAQTLHVPRLEHVDIDLTVLGFTLGLSLVTGILLGLVPALRHARASPIDALRESAGSSMSRGCNLAQRVLVVGEIAMAMLLLVGGGLLAVSFLKLSSVDPGYELSNVLTFELGLPAGRNVPITAETLTTRLSALPGVRSVGYTRQLPMAATRSLVPLRTGPELPTEPAPPPAPSGMVNPPQWPDTRHVSHGYLSAMRIPVVSGRGFDEGDEAGRQVLLINETLARSGLLGENPVGLYVYALGMAPWEVVGIVKDVRQNGLDQEAGPQVFIDIRQLPGAARLSGALYFVVRTTGEPAGIAPMVRQIVAEVDPVATVQSVATMEQLVANSVVRPRVYAILMGLFATIAAVLAAVGIYGLVSYSVSQRTREIGIRMALGARRDDVLKLVLGQSGRLIALGIATGAAGAVITTRYLRGMLFGVTPLDLPTFAAVSIVLVAVGALAAYLPARRATGVDPLIAIRCL